MNVIDSFLLNNKVAIVTGGYGHLGKGMAEALNEAGAKVVIAGRSEDKFMKAFASDKNYYFVETDISETDSIINCFKSVFNQFGRIDILINNAIYMSGGGKTPDMITDEEWDNCSKGVLGSVFKCIREVIPYMQNGGSIVNISSMYGVVSPDFSIYEGECSKYFNPANYGAAKAGVVQLTKYFATYLIPKKIKVNCISPGTFPSPSVQQNQIFINRLQKKNPANRIGTPEDLKGVIVFLSSEASSYIIGQNIVVDGGWTIW